MSAVIVDLQRRVAELEETVRGLEQDKKDLYDDLEQRLVHREGSFWSSSSVLADRLGQAENDRKRLSQELTRVNEERDSLREDTVQIQTAKRESDNFAKSEMDKNRILERELAFYKKQCARALEERNLFSYEIEELKRANLELEHSLDVATGNLENAVRHGEDLERQNEEATATIAQLEGRLVECARIPELEAQLQMTRHQRSELQTQHSKLQSLYKILQEDIDGAWATVDQLKDEKECLQAEYDALEARLTTLVETEQTRSAELEKRLEETTRELQKRNGQLQEADSRVAAAQAQAEQFRESQRQEVNDARVAAHETIERLKIQLEETEGLLTRKMAEVQAAIEAKVTAQENASEWESKWLMLSQKLQEKEEKPALLSRRSLEFGSFRNNRPERHLWFRRRSRNDDESDSNTTPTGESLVRALDLVVGLIPKLKSIYQLLESAEPSQTGSRRASLARLETVTNRTAELQKELESYPMPPHMDDAMGRLTAHVMIGMEAVHLINYGVARLKQLINVAH